MHLRHKIAFLVNLVFLGAFEYPMRPTHVETFNDPFTIMLDQSEPLGFQNDS